MADLIVNVYADCKTKQYNKAGMIKILVVDVKQKSLAPSSRQEQNELERPKLVPVSLKAEV